MTPQELKASILWAAIQGKLTLQNPGEPSPVLIAKKSRQFIQNEELYFDIPDNWTWCRIGDVFNLVNGRTFKPQEWSETGLPIVRIQNLNDCHAPYHYYSGDVESRYMLNGGELLFSWSGTPGTSFGAFRWKGTRAILNQHIFIVHPKCKIDTSYAELALNAELKIFIDKAHGGAGLKHITKKEFEACLIPLPPLDEQRRIVAKIEELLSHVDRYAEAWNRLELFRNRFPSDMRKALLQRAMQGRLVEQRPEEGTGAELYRKIQAEKRRRIKAGELKRDKPLPEIKPEEIPFDIPESWVWVRLGDVLEIQPSNGISPKGVPFETPIKNLMLTATTSGYFKADAYKYVDVPEKEVAGYYLEDEDILIQRSNSRELVGTSCIYRDTYGRFIYPDLMMRIHVFHCVSCEYIDAVLKSPLTRMYYQKKASGTSESMPKINQGIVRETLVPLPPLAEQRRIVAKLEELLPMCGGLA